MGTGPSRRLTPYRPHEESHAVRSLKELQRGVQQTICSDISVPMTRIRRLWLNLQSALYFTIIQIELTVEFTIFG